MSRTYSWWLLGHRHWGVAVKWAHDEVSARAELRDAIAVSFLEEGLSPSAAKRGASSYGVFVIAGGLSHDEAWSAADEWDAGNCDPASELGRRYRHRPTWSPPQRAA